MVEMVELKWKRKGSKVSKVASAGGTRGHGGESPNPAEWPCVHHTA